MQFRFQPDVLNKDLVFENAYLFVFFRSMVIGVAVTVCCPVIGFHVAKHLATRPERSHSARVLPLAIPFWVHFLLRAVSMLVSRRHLLF